MAGHSAKGSWDPEEDSDLLFSKHTVAEIRQLEQTTRKDVGEKREELRQMVGERYRDLISAADTIVEIKNTTNTVSTLVAELKGDVEHIRQLYQLKGFSGSAGDLEGPSAKSFVLMSQLKLFVDLPTKLWSCLETQSCLKAAQYHLVAQYLALKLNLGSGRGQGNRLLKMAPVFSSHCSSLVTFQTSILNACRESLRHSQQSQKAQAESLCAILLLEEGSLRQALSEFLTAKRVAVRSILQNQDHSSSAKTQIVTLAKLLRMSLSLIAWIFSQISEESSLIHRIVRAVTGKAISSDNADDDVFYEPLLSEFTSRTHYKHLPDDVKGFRPSLPNVLTDIPSTTIQTLASEWIESMRKEISKGLSEILQHVGTLKAVSVISAAVHSALAESTVEGMSSGEEWDVVWQHAIGRPFSIWVEFLEPVFLARTKAIIDHYLETLQSALLSELDRIASGETQLREEDLTFAPGLFAEDSCDTMTAGSIASSSHPTAWKVKSLSPTVLRICSQLDSDLDKLLIADVKQVLKPQKARVHLFASKHLDDKTDKSNFPFDLFSMDRMIRSHLSASTAGMVTVMMERVDQCLQRLKDDLQRASLEEAYSLIGRILVLGRICKGLKENCTSVHSLVEGLESSSSLVERKKFRLPSSASASSPGDNKPIAAVSSGATNVTDLLHQRYLNAHRIWTEWIKATVLDRFNSQLTGSASSSLNLSSALVWEEIVLTEEDESGASKDSHIHLPSQVSSYIHWLLFAVCRELTNGAGHSLPSSFLKHFSYSLLEAILGLYERFLGQMESKGILLEESCVIQMWFDVKVLTSVLVSQEKTSSSTRNSLQDASSRISHKLESIIDPFDLNVYLPYLVHLVDRQRQRCIVLLGPLVHLSSGGSLVGLAGKTKPPGLPQERHQVIPLPPQVGRFTMLPIGTGSMLKRPSTSAGNKLQTEQSTFPSVLDLYESSMNLFN